DLHDWMQHTFRINDSWSYAGLSSGGFAAAYLPMIAPYPVHAVCGLSGYYSGNIPPLAAYGRAAQLRVSPLAHPNHLGAITFIAYGTGDWRSTNSLTYIAALRKAHTKLEVQPYPGAHDWQVWTPAFLGCFRAIEPA
ncbi:MAG: hypothetical protein ACRDWT_09440, partial [Jatrophihabitantaceae bacterium]